jgi:hypothetical protein
VIINSRSWTDSNDYKILVDACKSFKMNTVLVVDDEVLQDELQKDLSDSPTPVKVINLPKTVEIYKTRATEGAEMRYTRIKEYFYGTEAESYNPMTSEFEFSYIKPLIYRIGNPLILPDALMPLGRKPQEKRTKVSHYDCKASGLLHHRDRHIVLQAQRCVVGSRLRAQDKYYGLHLHHKCSRRKSEHLISAEDTH